MYDVPQAFSILKRRLVRFWEDAHGRMRWVQDPQRQIIDPVEALCQHEQGFTLQPFLAQDIKSDVGQRLFEQFHTLRTYHILSEVTSYLYCTQDDQTCLEYGQTFFSSEDSFQKFCQNYAISALSKNTSCGFRNIHRVDLKDLLYGWYTHLSHTQGFRVCGYLSAHGHASMYEDIGAWEQGMLLLHMPYMEKGVKDLCKAQYHKKGQRFYVYDSFSCFHASFVRARGCVTLLALWPKIFKDSLSCLVHITHEMKAQMWSAQGNLKERLKIMWVFYHSVRNTLCPENLIPKNIDEFFACLEQSDFRALPDQTHTAILGNQISQRQALQQCNQWRKHYFVQGVKNIVRSMPIKLLEDSMWLFQEEFALYNVTAFEIFQIFENIQAVGRQSKWSVLEKYALGADILNDCACDSRDDAVKKIAALWKRDLRNYSNIRCTLWDIKQPFIGWNNTLQALVVCLPKKQDMVPLIQEMSLLQDGSIMQEMACKQVLAELCDNKSLTLSKEGLINEGVLTP